jgi:hypothetical protein
LEKIVYTIRDQSVIFQLATLSSLAGAWSLKNHLYSVIYYTMDGKC